MPGMSAWKTCVNSWWRTTTPSSGFPGMSAIAVSATGSRRPKTGISAATATGAPAYRCGLTWMIPRTLSVSGPSTSWRHCPGHGWMTCTNTSWTRSRSRVMARPTGGPRKCWIAGSSQGPCPSPSSITLSSVAMSWMISSRPISSRRASTRPAGGFIPCWSSPRPFSGRVAIVTSSSTGWSWPRTERK